MKRLIVILAAFLVFAPAAAANFDAGSKPFHAVTSAPEGLHAFLLRPDEAPLKYYPRTPSFAWSPVGVPGGTYEFELATGRSFNESSVLFSYKNLKMPAVAVTHQLPWMTGVPFALWAHVRWISANGKVTTPWSSPVGFNLRWTDDDFPQQLSAPEGLIRWKPIEGATRYEVLFPDIAPPYSFQTTTNVADEREFFTFKENNPAVWSAVRWRVRALRYTDDKDVLENGLPRVSYGPWSPTFTSVNPPLSLGSLTATDTVSDAWNQKGQTPLPHDLTPGFAWTPSFPVLSSVGPVGSSLYRVYIFTDDHCVNRVFTGSVVGSPAFAPRVNGGPLALPQSQQDLATWNTAPYLASWGKEGRAVDATGKPVESTELPGKGTPVFGNATPDANVDLWDSGWPNGRYYWTVVPVGVFPSGKAAAGTISPSIEYHDAAIPQDQCEAGIVMPFAKVSQPVVTAQSNTPWVSGVAPSGRLVASAARVPTVHDSPLVAWQPAVGATTYEVQVSRMSYPWKTTWSTRTPGTSVVLPLAASEPGTWWYRVRGINPALPVGAQTMSWSNTVRLRVTGDRFVIVKK
ncbi:MAG: hypothetical protein JWO17_14 [Actinomycetia bacterium]|nr:hypothetical protein [Actinomycetes bacterium]